MQELLFLSDLISVGVELLRYENSAVLNGAQPISLLFLKDIVSQMWSSTCCTNVVPMNVFESVGTSVLSIVNSFLATQSSPSTFKHAVV